MLVRYNYFHKGLIHPMVSDYVSAAKKAALKLVKAERLMPRTPSYSHTPFAPDLLEDIEPGVMDEFVRDISQLRPGATRKDLSISFVAMAFARRLVHEFPRQSYRNTLAPSTTPAERAEIECIQVTRRPTCGADRPKSLWRWPASKR